MASGVTSREDDRRKIDEICITFMNFSASFSTRNIPVVFVPRKIDVSDE